MVDLSREQGQIADADPLGEFTPIPAGVYEAVIVSSELKENSKKTGHYLQLVFQIVSGDHAKRQLFVRLNIRHPNPVAVDLAIRELKSICLAAGMPDGVSDSSDLHDLPMLIKVAQVKRKDNGETTNEIKGYKPRKRRVAKTAARPAAQPRHSPAPQPEPQPDPADDYDEPPYAADDEMPF